MFDVAGKLGKMKKQPSLPLAALNESIRVLELIRNFQMNVDCVNIPETQSNELRTYFITL